jgi:hypothetical protein
MLDGDPWGRAMWSWEFRALCEKYLHPRFWSIWIHCDRWGLRQRESQGIPLDLATLFVSTVQGPPEDILVVPQNQLPFKTQLETYAMGPDGLDLGFKAAHKGWRSCFHHLLREGVLKPCYGMSELLHEDSYAIAPKKFGGHL